MNGRLVDGFNRRVKYLRMSITDRCNLSCAYCRPGVSASRHTDCGMLPLRDMLRLAKVFAGLGVSKIRITGGEPLLRKGIINFIGQISAIHGIGQVAITTNGLMLNSLAGKLRDAGARSVNISLDSLDRAKYQSITGHDGLGKVMSGIRATMAAGFQSVKMNMVVIRGVNDNEIPRFVKLSRVMKAQVRFIELMPTAAAYWNEKRFVPMSEVKSIVENMGVLSRLDTPRWSGPAEVYHLAGAKGELGFISAVSRHFCADCNRLRLTSSGKLLTCLFGGESVDLGAMAGGGASDEEISVAIINAVMKKNGVRNELNEEAIKPQMVHVGG
ncbi:MAG: GTP 3',8-cyclase MoaA [Nitrospinae bacterium]|nr:GTP 3',8-cyclase MoaA [Nitrospinota bacterium]